MESLMTRSRLLLSLVVLAPVYLSPLWARADAPQPGGKNLQVLPKTLTKDQVKAIMKAQTKALGVECDFCHEVPDMASDKNEHKKITREMMRLTDELNAKWFNGKVAPKATITCNTCHKGKEKPEG
jgi:hypothetical protein